jgi:hypothetical protein
LSDAAYADDRGELHAAHLYTLRELLSLPARHTKRVVERVSFLPSGGERWQRDVQITIPPAEFDGARVPGGGFVVSLGLFRRSRFPDFVVHDADGRRLPLVTRAQHRHCVAMATLMKYLDDARWQRMPQVAHDEWETVYRRLGDLITDVACDDDHSIAEIENAARDLFDALDLPNAAEAASDLGDECRELAHYTHYLCWVPANWSERVSLSASYTMADTVRVAGDARKALPATVEDEEPPDEEDDRWQKLRMRVYTRLGLCPVYYEFRTPAHDHAGSYYFSVEPPTDAHVSVLDWGTGRCFGETTGEVDNAFPTCHIHNGDQAAAPGRRRSRRKIDESKISAFLKADPVDNAALLAVAILNIALAYLAQQGSFLPRLEGQQQWILLAPVILVALIAQHRSRYYSEVTRPLRAVMWIYLAINVLFGASVAFDVFDGGSTTHLFGLVPLDDAASGGMACVSLGLVLLLFTSGKAFEQMTAKLYRRRLATEPGSARYLAVARRYADVASAAILVLVTVAVVWMVQTDWGSERRAEAEWARNLANGEVNHRPPANRAGVPARPDFDVFLAYDGADRLAVERLARLLRRDGLRPWMADAQIPPGRWFQSDIEAAIDRVGATAIVIGEHGLGHWQAVELRAFMAEGVERGLPVVPVLLPDATVPPELRFMRQLSWVRFDRDVAERDVLSQLRWGITGETSG